MQAIIVPAINSNDLDANLLAWTKSNGDAVRIGETLAVLETTKASFDLAAETNGVFHSVAQAGERCEFGATIGYVFADEKERAAFISGSAPKAREAVSIDETIITNAAKEMMSRLGISLEQIRALGKKVIKVKDLEALIPPAATTGELMPSSQQQSIARLVSRSRASIPDSFLVKKIIIDRALEALAEFSRTEKIMSALPDLLVWNIGRLPERFPFFFGALGDDLRFRPAIAGNIGVTFDLGNGLFVPVLKNAGSSTLREVAQAMMRFRMKALRGQFQTEDLTGGDISLSINMDTDILLVQPIILPPQTCMLSSSAVLTELALDSNGTPIAQRFIQLGVAFDHRVINAFAANAFVNAIKARLEDPHPIEECGRRGS